jgi:hypothetical protein
VERGGRGDFSGSQATVVEGRRGARRGVVEGVSSGEIGVVSVAGGGGGDDMLRGVCLERAEARASRVFKNASHSCGNLEADSRHKECSLVICGCLLV